MQSYDSLTANGEVQTHEDAIVYVKELDIFLTMKVLDKARQQYCRSESFAMKTCIPTNGSMVKKPHLIKDGIRIICNTENFVPIVVPGLSSSSSGSSLTSMTPLRQENHSSSIIFFILVFFTYSKVKFRLENEKVESDSDITSVKVSNSGW